MTKDAIEDRPTPTEAAARLSAEGQALLRRWIAGRAADLSLGELVALLESGLDDLKTYRAALDRLTDERDEHAMECMRLQTEGAYDVGYQRGAERSKAELDAIRNDLAAERERADRLAEALSNIGLMAALGVGSPTPSGISRLDYLYRIGAESERALAASPTTPATPGPAAPESGEDA